MLSYLLYIFIGGAVVSQIVLSYVCGKYYRLFSEKIEGLNEFRLVLILGLIGGGHFALLEHCLKFL